MNLHENKQAFSDAIIATANALNIKRHFVEKDYCSSHDRQSSQNDYPPRGAWYD